MHEQLTQAHDCVGFTVRDLRAALGKATAIEALVILPMIERAARLQHSIAALQLAKREAKE